MFPIAIITGTTSSVAEIVPTRCFKLSSQTRLKRNESVAIHLS
jgi:hypothetical protein